MPSPAVSFVSTRRSFLGPIVEVDPRAPVNSVNPMSDATKTVLGVSGHPDSLATQCPGTRSHHSWKASAPT